MIEIRDQIERRGVDSLVPYARNSRTHSEVQVAQIATLDATGEPFPAITE